MDPNSLVRLSDRCFLVTSPVSSVTPSPSMCFTRSWWLMKGLKMVRQGPKRFEPPGGSFFRLSAIALAIVSSHLATP